MLAADQIGTRELVVTLKGVFSPVSIPRLVSAWEETEQRAGFLALKIGGAVAAVALLPVGRFYGAYVTGETIVTVVLLFHGVYIGVGLTLLHHYRTPRALARACGGELSDLSATSVNWFRTATHPMGPHVWRSICKDLGRGDERVISTALALSNELGCNIVELFETARRL